MTPHELGLYILDYITKAKQDEEAKIRLAYLSAYLQRVEKMPPLSDFLEKEPEPKQQTPETMLEFVKMANAALGGTMQ